MQQLDVRIKLAFLWTTIMALYIYADYFGLMVPGHLEALMNQKSPIGPITPGLLIGFSVLLIIPALMIAVSATMRQRINRLFNIIFGIVYAIVSILMIVSSLGSHWMVFFILYQVVELGIFSLIVWYAWKWH
jgi:hypothetical protein